MSDNIDQSKKPETSKSSDSLYLEQLEFKPKDAKTPLNFLLTNVRVIYLCMVAIVLWGFVGFGLLPLESNPEVKIPFGIVSVALPGASPADVEELVVKKIEKKVANLKGVKTVTSSALNSFGTVSVEFRAEEDLKEALRRLRDAVDSIKSELPTDALDPVVSEVSFDSTPVWIMVLTGPYDGFTLRNYAEKVADELENLPGTSEVQISGGDQKEIHISINPEKLELYGLSLDQINGVLRGNNLTLPLGEVSLGKFEYSLRLDGKYSTPQEIRDLPVTSANGNLIRLKDVAEVAERAIERKSFTRFSIAGSKPQNAVSISVVKKTGFSILELVDQGKSRVESLLKNNLPENLKIETTYDISETIREDFNDLSSEGINTVLLVTLILFLFVGLKEAFTAGIVIPLVFAATFGLMQLAGQTLNFLSLFSLILSLGLLVDDAIVVVQATKQYMATGKFTPEQAVLLVFKDFFAIILTTSLTTIFAFLPLLLASGIIGQFIRSIPITACLTLAASTIIAIAINHPLAAILERFRPTRNTFKLIFIILLFAFVVTFLGSLSAKSVLAFILPAILFFLLISLLLWYRRSLKAHLANNEQILLEEQAFPQKIKEKLQHHYSENTEKSFWVKATSGVVKVDKFLPYYERLLNWFLASGWRAAALFVSIIVLFIGSLALPATGLLKSEFLPPSDQELMYINIEGAPGLVLSETQKVADQVEAILLQEKQIKNFSVVVGSVGRNLSGGATGAGVGTGGQTNRAQFTINLWPEQERSVKQKSYEYAPELREKLTSVSGAKVTLEELRGGPPSGADFEVRFTGEDLVKLEQLANQYKALLADIPGTVNEKTSLTLSPGEFTFKLDPDALMLRGMTPAQIASTIRTAISGSEITKIIEGEDEVKLRVDYLPSTVDSVDNIKALTLISPRGERFQLGEVAEVSLGSSVTSISRINEKRVIVLSSSVQSPVLPGEVLSKFQQILLEKPLPAGYEAVFGGQNDTNAESILSILRAMIVAFVLIIGTMVIQFNSFRKAILVLLTIPLAMTGVFYGLTLIGFTLSFPTLIGLVALFGIVVKNAIILIDKININIKVGIPFHEAITDAAKSRLEAIFLTTAATVIGMIPITLYDETWEGLGAALIFGLISSTVLTLLVIPILFSLLFRKDAAREEKIRELRQQSIR